VAKRISGPGVASAYYYQIEPELALILLEVLFSLLSLI